jgi:Sulfotransferase family
MTDTTQGGRVPDFFLVGHQKSGTTAMHLMLDQHPGVFMPAVKEPRYFASDLRSRFQGGEAGPGRPQTLEGYMALFAAARPHQLVGDASATYLRSKVAARGIAEVQPQARIVAVLREPASYVRSLHLQLLASNVETERDLRRALALEPERREGRSIPAHTHHPEALLYSEHVHYVEQLRRFHDAFPRERVLVLIYEDFKRDNLAVFGQVLDFLGLDRSVEIEPVRTKPVREARSVLAHRLVGRVRLAKRAPERVGSLARAVATLIPSAALSPRFGARWRRALYSEQKPADEALMAELRERFRPEVERLSEYLERDMLARWGYGEPG